MGYNGSIYLRFKERKDSIAVRNIINFVENNPKHTLPSRIDDAKLARDIQTFKDVNKNTGVFYVIISYNDLIRLATSKYESLRILYESIMDRYINVVEGEYHREITDYKKAYLYINNLKDKEDITYYLESDAINKLIEFVENNKYNRLPTVLEDRALVQTIRNIRNISDKTNKFKCYINYIDLVRLGTSKYDVLRKIYDEIMDKYINIVEGKYNLVIPSYRKAYEYVNSIKREDIIYYEISDKSRIDELEDYVKNDEFYRRPSISENKDLSLLYQSFKNLNKDTHRFHNTLSYEDLIILGTSKYEALRKLYDFIMDRYINEVENIYGDKIDDYRRAYDDIEKLKKEGKLNKIEYFEDIEDNKNIKKLINYVKESKLHRLPNREENSELYSFYNNIRTISSNTNFFSMRLSFNDLIRLGTSECKALRDLYRYIIDKHNNDVDDKHKSSIYKEAYEYVKDLEEQGCLSDATILEEKNDSYEIDDIIKFVGVNDRLSTRGEEAILARCITNIKTISPMRKTFKKVLSYNDLVKLGTSNYDALNKVYLEIKDKYFNTIKNEYGTVINDYERAFNFIDKYNKISSIKNYDELFSLFKCEDLVRMYGSHNELERGLYYKIINLYIKNNIFIKDYEKAMDIVNGRIWYNEKVRKNIRK